MVSHHDRYAYVEIRHPPDDDHKDGDIDFPAVMIFRVGRSQLERLQEYIEHPERYQGDSLIETRIAELVRRCRHIDTRTRKGRNQLVAKFIQENGTRIDDECDASFTLPS